MESDRSKIKKPCLLLYLIHPTTTSVHSDLVACQIIYIPSSNLNRENLFQALMVSVQTNILRSQICPAAKNRVLISFSLEPAISTHRDICWLLLILSSNFGEKRIHTLIPFRREFFSLLPTLLPANAPPNTFLC